MWYIRYALVMLGSISKLQLPVSHVITGLVTGTLQCTLLPVFSGYCVLWFCIMSTKCPSVSPCAFSCVH